MEEEEIVENDEMEVEQTTPENVETQTTEQKVEQQEFTPEQQRKILWYGFEDFLILYAESTSKCKKV